MRLLLNARLLWHVAGISAALRYVGRNVAEHLLERDWQALR